MREFNYLHPQTVEETVQLLHEYGQRAKLLAGGTDLLIQLRKDGGSKELEAVINIAHLRELNYIKEDDEWIRIGANTTHAQVANSELILRDVQALADAARTVGSPQIRNRGTIGGNIINASPAADPVPVLVALEAVVTIQSVRGSREIPLTDIYVKPYQTNIASDELLTEIAFKKLPATARSAFIKLGRRNALAIARMNVAVIVDRDAEGVVRDIRIVPGSTMPRPGRVQGAEAVLLGQKLALESKSASAINSRSATSGKNDSVDTTEVADLADKSVMNLTEELIQQAGQKVAEEMVALTGRRWSTEFKEPVIAALTRRGIRQALEGLR